MSDFYLAQNDTASPLFETLEDENGLPISIQGATVSVTIVPIHGGAAIVSHAANNLQVGDGSDGSKGKVSYGEGANPWGAATASAGDFLYQWQVTFGGGTIQSFPNNTYRLLTILVDAPTTAQEYASVEELKKTLSLTGTTYSDEDIKLALQAATASINNECGRSFLLGSPAEARTFYPVSPMYLLMDDAAAVTSVTSNGTTLVLGTDYYLDPVRAAKPGPPYDTLRSLAVPGIYGPFGFGFLSGTGVTVTGTWGWPSVPPPIKQATKILAGRYVQRSRSAPFAILTFGDGGEAARITRSDPDVAMLLEPYTRSRMIE